jgi:acetyltransferase
LLDGLKAQKFTGTLQFFDINTSGTLADLAQIRADLAIIVPKPNKDLPAALEIAGRMNCRAALVLSNGVDAELAGQLHKIARREGMHLLGPNSPGIQRSSLSSTPAPRPLAQEGSLALCQSGALTSSILDWASNNGVGFSSVISLGLYTDMGLSEALDFSGQRRAHAKHRGLHGRHTGRTPLCERHALGFACQAGGGAESRAQAGGQQGRADAQRCHRRQRRCL